MCNNLLVIWFAGAHSTIIDVFTDATRIHRQNILISGGTIRFKRKSARSSSDLLEDSFLKGTVDQLVHLHGHAFSGMFGENLIDLIGA